MPTHWGNEGVVKVGSQAIAEMDNWSFTLSRSPVEDSAMGDAFKTYIAGSGMKEWSGQCECHWSEDDAGQIALDSLPSVTLNMYPEGATTGDTYYTGLVEINQQSVSVKKDGDTVRASFNFVGNGALVKGTV
jgi:hypothetical protein